MAKWVGAAAVRGFFLALTWIALSGESVWSYIGYGAVAVTLCTALSLWLVAPRPLRLREWPRRSWAALTLIVWFLRQSAVGGVDVAWRAIKRRVDVDPAVMEAPLKLTSQHGQQIAIALMSLMPGALVQRVVENAEDLPTVELHTIARELHPVDQWNELQGRVAAVIE